MWLSRKDFRTAPVRGSGDDQRARTKRGGDDDSDHGLFPSFVGLMLSAYRRDGSAPPYRTRRKNG